jgi:hypothetical protein
MNAANIQCVNGLVRGFLHGPISNLGRRYIVVYLAVRLSTSGNKLEFVPQRCRAWSMLKPKPTDQTSRRAGASRPVAGRQGH